MFLAQRALNGLRWLHLENVPPNDVDVPAIFLLDLVKNCGRCIELNRKVAAGPMDESVFADLVRQRPSAQILQFANYAAIIEDLFCCAFQGGD